MTNLIKVSALEHILDVNPDNLNSWLRSFDRFIRLDSNQYAYDKYASAEGIVACGIERAITIEDFSDKSSVSSLKNFFDENKGQWIFGHMSFEAKDLFDITKTNASSFIDVPCVSFFVPTHVFKLLNDKLIILKSNLPVIELQNQLDQSLTAAQPIIKTKGILNFGVDRSQYIEHVNELLQHIHRGDIYEVNYCQALQYKGMVMDPYALYTKMQSTSQAPFGAFYRNGDVYLCSASPERFMAKRGDQLICQPIKGTNRRLDNPEENIVQQAKLKSSLKERAENVMIVDLMRNDMSRICLPGSVHVEELYGIYAFRHVNQMISTISGAIDQDINFVDVISALFPMGSMTGAPKLSALALIDELEPYQRGLFSGTVGYIDPNANWDFNVVIRSIVYDDAHQLASISAGGAITALSDAAEEYEESLLKMESLVGIINGE